MNPRDEEVECELDDIGPLDRIDKWLGYGAIVLLVILSLGYLVSCTAMATSDPELVIERITPTSDCRTVCRGTVCQIVCR